MAEEDNIGARKTMRLAAIAFCALAVLAVTIGLASQRQQTASGQCGGAGLDFAAVNPKLVGATPQPANAGSLSEITNSVHLLAESSYGQFYAGVAMDTETDLVTVWRKESSDFDRALMALPGREKIVIRCADYSLRELLSAAGGGVASRALPSPAAVCRQVLKTGRFLFSRPRRQPSGLGSRERGDAHVSMACLFGIPDPA